jgi:hypothetical protein
MHVDERGLFCKRMYTRTDVSKGEQKVPVLKALEGWTRVMICGKTTGVCYLAGYPRAPMVFNLTLYWLMLHPSFTVWSNVQLHLELEAYCKPENMDFKNFVLDNVLDWILLEYTKVVTLLLPPPPWYDTSLGDELKINCYIYSLYVEDIC